MKPTLFFVALAMLFAIRGDAQMLALADQTESQFTVYSSANFTGNKHERTAGIILVSVGGATMGLGGMTTLVGALVCYGAYEPQNYIGGQEVINQTELHQGHVIEVCGVVVGAGGLVMLVAGVSKLKAYHHPRFRVVAPRSNAVGLAYDF